MTDIATVLAQATADQLATVPIPNTIPYSIPTFSDATDYTIRVRLEGRDFNLSFRWNEREDRWYLDIASDVNAPIVSGIKIVTNWPLLRFYKWDDRLPQGEMIALDATNDRSPPTRYELGQSLRVQLRYYPAVNDDST